MFIECKVMGKQRPRVATRGGYPTIYTPTETHKFEDMIARSYRGKLYHGNVEVVIRAILSPAKSISKKKRAELLEAKWCDKKPDIDNIAKIVLDGLNSVAYDDDKQVVCLRITKEWGEIEGLDIEVIGE